MIYDVTLCFFIQLEKIQLTTVTRLVNSQMINE